MNLNKVLLALAILFGVWLVLTIVGNVVGQVGQVTGLPISNLMSGTSLFLLIVAVFVYGKGWLDKRNQKSAGAQFAYTATMGILFISAILFFFFGGRWLSDPVTQKAFDLRTGEPQYMVYTHNDKVVRGSENGELLRPSDCRPEGVPHKGFDYATKGTCFSPVDNARMRPVEAGDVPEGTVKSAVLRVWGSIWGNKNSPNATSFSETGETSSVVLKCPEQSPFMRHLQPGTSEEICIDGNAGQHFYFFAQGIGSRVKVRFDDTPVKVSRQFDTFPEKESDLISVSYYGDGSSMNCAQVTDTVCIRPNRQAFLKYHLSGTPVWFQLTVEPYE